MRISVLGVGAIGAIMAAHLAQTEHELHLHVRGVRGARMMLEGVVIEGLSLPDVPPERLMFSSEELPLDDSFEHRTDVLILASKSYALDDLLPLAHRLLKPEGIAFTVCNGLGHVEAMTRWLGPERVLAATTTLGAYAEGERTVWAGAGSVGLAVPPLGPGDHRVAPVVALMESAGLSIERVHDAMSLVWQKVLLNVAVNPVAALAGLNNGELLDAALFSTCMSVYREAALVAKMERVTVDDEVAFEHRLREVLTATGDNACSMLQDIKAGRRTEIDALNAFVVELAEHHGVSVPLNRALSAMVKACHP